MKLWIRKLFVITMTVFTLGIYVPAIPQNADASNQKDIASNPNYDDLKHGIETVGPGIQDSSLTSPSLTNETDYTEILLDKAHEQIMMKFGPRITPRIETEFSNDILPVIEKVLKTVVDKADRDVAPYYEITEHPASGIGERIFNVYDGKNNKTIAKFHVRRENRPLEGYWFNFHYHLSDDNFVQHHFIGDVYWDKNIPPKWMA